MNFRKEILELTDREYIIIRELSYIMGINVDELLVRMIDKWLNSKDCSPAVRRYIYDYKLELDTNKS